MDNQELTAEAWRLAQPHVEPSSGEPTPIGIGGWLGFFCFQRLATLVYLAVMSGTVHLPRYILLNLLIVTVMILVLLLLWKRSPLFFVALYVEFALRIGTPLEDVRVHWLFVHRHHYSLVGDRPYFVLIGAAISVGL